MRSTVIWSFLSLLALATGGLISGCDSDAKIAKSAEGESCDNTTDCNDGLKCLQGACYKGATGGGNEGGEGAGTGGSVAGPPAPVLSGVGESCTKRADCEDELACFNQVCVETGGGEGGGGNLPDPRLGALGETCTVTADCSLDLTCQPGGLGSPLPVGYQGVCSRPSGAYIPTGKNCMAECLEDADCYQLPLEVQGSNLLAAYGVDAESCADLAVQLDGVNCATALTGSANAAKCFAQTTYCDPDSEVWTCTAGMCNYTADCSASGANPDGCPNFSRSGRVTISTCNLDDKCEPPAVMPTCTTDASCNGELMADLGLVCEDGECTCYDDTQLCYRRCDKTLDCRAGQVCDDATKVCVPQGACTTDAQCAISMLNPRSRCVDEMCQLGCATDYECNNGSLAGGVNALICAPDKICRPIGCSIDAQCSTGANNTGVNMFCTTPEPAAAGTVVNSAITD